MHKLPDTIFRSLHKEGRDVATPVLLLALIHPSAWKMNSRKWGWIRGDSGAIETEVFAGDVFWIGEATVQVSQPRVPCAKLAGKNGSKMLPKLMASAGYTSFYMRVLSEGVMAAGNGFDLERPRPERITIADVNAIIYGKKSNDLALIKRLA